jgi:5'-nucleotidase
VGEVLVVAPEGEQTGAGTSVSLRGNLSIAEAPSPVPGVRAYAVGGTPTDCVILGLWRLARGQTDLVVSGINIGPNMGHDIPYSGTVMATLQGYFRKIPSVAISLAIREWGEELRFNVAARVAGLLASAVKSGVMPSGAIFNTNVPNIPLEQIKGIATTRAASSGYTRLAQAQRDGSVNVSVSIGGPASDSFPHQVSGGSVPAIEEGTDIWAINSGFVSITPLGLDVTNHGLMPALAEHVQALESDLLKAKSEGGG